jgi:Ca2+-binding RTX toxin-like protein
MIDAESIDKSAIPDIHAVELSPAEVTVEGYVFEGTDKEDWLKASDGDDVILGGGGDDHLYGLGGNDRFVYREGDGADIVLGGEGTDTIDATDAKTLQLTELTAEHSVETIFGNEGGLQIEGTANNDVLDFQNTTLKNVSGIDAGQGNDQVTGSSDNDVIAAGAGDDTLSGGDGDGDVLVLSGNRSEYKVVEQKDGSIEIYDSRGADGNDLVREFERFSFADETVDREGLFRDPSDTLMISDTSVREDVSADTVVAKLYTANDEKSGPHSFTLVDETGN